MAHQQDPREGGASRPQTTSPRLCSGLQRRVPGLTVTSTTHKRTGPPGAVRPPRAGVQDEVPAEQRPEGAPWAGRRGGRARREGLQEGRDLRCARAAVPVRARGAGGGGRRRRRRGGEKSAAGAAGGGPQQRCSGRRRAAGSGGGSSSACCCDCGIGHDEEEARTSARSIETGGGGVNKDERRGMQKRGGESPAAQIMSSSPRRPRFVRGAPAPPLLLQQRVLPLTTLLLCRRLRAPS